MEDFKDTSSQHKNSRTKSQLVQVYIYLSPYGLCKNYTVMGVERLIRSG